MYGGSQGVVYPQGERPTGDLRIISVINCEQIMHVFFLECNCRSDTCHLMVFAPKWVGFYVSAELEGKVLRHQYKFGCHWHSKVFEQGQDMTLSVQTPDDLKIMHSPINLY